MNHEKALKLRKIYWKEEEEKLLKIWADKAQCYQWIHTRCRDVYQRKNAAYTIPVIIISTIVGTANFAQDRFSEENRQYVAMGIGTLSIAAGIISTISQFLKISEINEAHRIASISWGKFYRNIKTELQRHPLDRSNPYDIISFNKEEFDRLVEISPAIPKKILLEFKNKFKKVENLIKPEICDELTSTEVYNISQEDRDKIIDDIFKVEKKEQTKIDKEKDKELEEKYRETFFNLNGRYPNNYEIQRYLEKLNEEKIDIPEEEKDDVSIV